MSRLLPILATGFITAAIGCGRARSLPEGPPDLDLPAMTFEWLAAILATCHGTVLDAYDVRRASGGRWWVAPTGSIGSVPTFEIDDKQCNERHHRSVKVGVLELDEALDHTMRCVNEQLANKSRAGRRLDLRNPVIHVRGGQVTVELVEIEPGPAPDPVEFRFAASPGPCSLIDPHARR